MGSLTEPGAHILARQGTEQALGMLPHPTLSWVLRMQIEVFLHAWQALYQPLKKFIFIFLKITIYFYFMCTYECLHVYMCITFMPSALRGPNRAWGPLESELQTV